MSETNPCLIPFGTITVTEKAIQLVNQALQTKRLSSGRFVREFEEKFANLIGVKEAVALSSGTDADALALAVLYDFGASRGDEIIVPALSFVATGNSVLQAGFTPSFVDVEMETLNINPDLIESVVSEKTKAIMPVHLMGKPACMDKINEIARKYNLVVIEDAAEAHGSELNGKKIGSIGDMAAFSLYLAHMVTTVEGGIVTTNNPEYAEILRSLRSHGRACKCRVCTMNTKSAYCSKRFNDEYDTDRRFVFERMGFSTKMNEMEAAVGLGSIDVFDEIMNKRRENFIYMSESLKEFDDGFHFLKEEQDEIIGPHAFPMILKENLDFTRDEFVKYLEENGVDSRNLFFSMPTQCQGFNFLNYRLGEFPISEYIGKHGLHIGIHQDIGKKEIDAFVVIVRKFLKNRNN